MALGPPNLSSTVARFAFPVTKIRYETASTRNSDGIKVPPVPVESPSRAHVFDAPAATIERLGLGQERSRVVEGHSPDPDWRTAPKGGPKADRIRTDTETFEIFHVQRWNEGPIGKRSWVVLVAIKVED